MIQGSAGLPLLLFLKGNSSQQQPPALTFWLLLLPSAAVFNLAANSSRPSKPITAEQTR